MKLIGIVLIVVAVALAALLAASFLGGIPFGSRADAGCDGTFPRGEPLTADVVDTGVERDGTRETRVVTFTLSEADASATQATADLCNTIGDIRVSSSADDHVRVIFEMESTRPWGSRGLDNVDVVADFTSDGDGLRLAAWRGQGSSRFTWFDGGLSVALRLQIPERMGLALDATTDVGDITLVDLRTLRVDVATDVGDVTFEPKAVLNDMDAQVDVGDATLILPDGPYEIRASSDVGGVEFDAVGNWSAVSDLEGPGERLEARRVDAQGLSLDVTVDVGSVRVSIEP